VTKLLKNCNRERTGIHFAPSKRLRYFTGIKSLSVGFYTIRFEWQFGIQRKSIGTGGKLILDFQTQISAIS
jgi:hypothetical protein